MAEKLKPLIIGIGRDHAQLKTIANADLRIIGNRVEGGEMEDTLALNDILADKTNMRSLLAVYDGDVLAAVAGVTGVEFPTEIAPHIKEFQEKVINRINKIRGDRPIRIVSYYAVHNIRPFAERLGGDVSIETEHHETVVHHSEKLNTWRLAEELEIPRPKGFVYDPVKGPVQEQLKTQSMGPFVFAANVGSPDHPHNFKADIKELPTEMKAGTQYLITEWMEKKSSPNSQVIIGEPGAGSIVYLGEMDQLIKEETKYAGNMYPSSSSDKVRSLVREYSMRLAKRMQEDGYRGVAGFDWIVTPDDRVFLAETNPRYNRSSPLLFSILNAMNEELLREQKCESMPDLVERMMKTPQLVPELKQAVGEDSKIFYAMGTYHPSDDSVATGSGRVGHISERDFLEDAYHLTHDENAPTEFGDFLLLNVPIAGTSVPAESVSIMRIQAYGSSREEALRQLALGKKAAAQCFTPSPK